MPSIGRHISRLSGYAAAVPTPFGDDGNVDGAAFERFCDLQVKAGTTALVVCGTTGEAPTLSPDEHKELVRIAVSVARGVPVIAGTGSNSTAHAIELTKAAEAAGADAILSVVPYYNRPTQAGIYAHFCRIAEATALPIILYDVPSRTACGIADQTVAQLAAAGSQFVGLKDATGDVSRVLRLRALVGSEFRLLSGDDATALAFLATGGDGCISVTSNVAPGLCRNMFLAIKQSQTARAQRLAIALAELTAALFRESNPVPVKYALSLLGLMSSKVRLPLVELTEQSRTEVASVMTRMCDIYAEWMIGSIFEPADGNRRSLAV